MIYKIKNKDSWWWNDPDDLAMRGGFIKSIEFKKENVINTFEIKDIKDDLFFDLKYNEETENHELLNWNECYCIILT